MHFSSGWWTEPWGSLRIEEVPPVVLAEARKDFALFNGATST